MSAEPYTEHVALRDGGDLWLSLFHDGNCSLTVNTDQASFTVRVGMKDVEGVRRASGGLIIEQHTREVQPGKVRS